MTLDGQQLRAQGRRGADRRHHELHQHLQPLGACSAPACSRARRAQRGLKAKPWVKTSLAPGSRVVTDYFTKAGVLDDLAAVGFDLVGYGCTTCIGNSGPLKPEISAAVKAGDSPPARCSPATATSRAACIRKCA